MTKYSCSGSPLILTADGISEDVITGLSKLRWFFVIARNSSFTYKSNERQYGD